MGFLFEMSENAEGVVGVMFVAGCVAVVFLTGVFLMRGKYRRSPRVLSPVEFEAARRGAEAMVAGLSPRVISLVEKERKIRELSGGRAEAGRALDEVARSGVWGRFAVAAALVEEEPSAATEELREVEAIVEAMIARMREVEESSTTSFGKEKS